MATASFGHLRWFFGPGGVKQVRRCLDVAECALACQEELETVYDQLRENDQRGAANSGLRQLLPAIESLREAMRP